MLRDIKVEVVADGIHVKVDPVGIQGKKGDPFVYEDFTADQLEALRGPEGPPGDIQFLTTDSSLYKNGNEMCANISTYKQQWNFAASSSFSFDFEPSNILQVMINRAGAAILPDYTFTAPTQLTIDSPLQAGDQITAIYEHFIIQP